MLTLDLCGCSDAYIVVKGAIYLLGDENASMLRKDVAFKNIASFRSYISKINNTLIGNAEDLDIVMLMYNLYKYNTSTSMQPPVPS